MKKADMDKLKGCYEIRHSSDYIVFFGKDLWVLRKKDQTLMHRADLKNIYKLELLPNNRILIECGSKLAYLLLDVTTCQELQQYTHPECDYSSFRFAQSFDGRFVYDYISHAEKLSVVTIDTFSFEILCKDVYKNGYVTSDIDIDSDGRICLLQSVYATIDCTHMSENGVRIIEDMSVHSVSSLYWKHKWTCPFPRKAQFFFLSTKQILTNDLQIYDIYAKTLKPLCNQVDAINKRKYRTPSCYYDENQNFFYLHYDGVSFVIDMSTSNLVAQYATQMSAGVVIDDKFWVVTDKGLQLKPFPLFEDIPSYKTPLWKPSLK